jgi:2-dehydropantoate 2-reductase
MASRASSGSAPWSARSRVLGGVAYIAATIGEPGVVVHTGTMARLRFGPVLPAQQRVAEALHARARTPGIEAELSADIRRALWEKFAFLAAFSGVTSVARQPMGVVRGDPDLNAALETAIRETWAVGRAKGIALADDFVAQQMKFAESLPAEMKSSMLNDLVAGNRLEAPVAMRRRGENGQRRGRADARQRDALRRPQTLLRRRRALAPATARGGPFHAASLARLARQRAGACSRFPMSFRG